MFAAARSVASRPAQAGFDRGSADSSPLSITRRPTDHIVEGHIHRHDGAAA
jgi:hypothetical protein